MEIIKILKLNFKIFFCSIIILFSSINILLEKFDKTTNNIAALFVLLISIYLVYAYRNNIMLFIIYFALLFFNYSIIIPVYFQTADVFLFRAIKNDMIYGIGIYILLFFMLLLLLFKKNNINESKLNTLDLFENNVHKNILIVILILGILGIIILALILNINVFGYNIGALYEYSILFFILGYFYSGKNSYWKIVLTFILLLYTLITFVDGDRVSVLQMIIASFLLLFHDKVNYKSLLPFILLGILLMTWLGLYSDNIDIKTLTLPQTINFLKERSFSLDTAYAAYYASLTFVIVKGIVPFSTEITLFGKFLYSLILGGSMAGDFSLPEYTKQYVFHYGGGVLPMYFYFYLGWAGIIIPAALISAFSRRIQNLNKDSSNYSKLLSIYIVSTVPRWYLYSPTSLTRGVLLFTIVYYIFYFIHKKIKI